MLRHTGYRHFTIESFPARYTLSINILIVYFSLSKQMLFSSCSFFSVLSLPIHAHRPFLCAQFTTDLVVSISCCHLLNGKEYKMASNELHLSRKKSQGTKHSCECTLLHTKMQWQRHNVDKGSN